jgi:hypothetical protein
MSSHARFAIAFSETSVTERPVTTESVNVLFTSGFPKGPFSANGVLKCTWFVFIVRFVNQMLSVSVIVRPSRLRYTSPTVKSSKNRPCHPVTTAIPTPPS